MGQAYEAYAETSACSELRKRGIALQRTPGTGQHKKQRPDFVHKHVSGDIFFEIKALDIADKLTRHQVIAKEGLEVRAELEQRARTPGVHFGRPQIVSGHRPAATAVQRIDETASASRTSSSLSRFSSVRQFWSWIWAASAGCLSDPQDYYPSFSTTGRRQRAASAANFGRLLSANLGSRFFTFLSSTETAI